MNIRCQHSCFSGLFLAFAMPLPGPDYLIEIQWIVLIPHSGNQPFSCTTDISFEFRIHGICSSKCQTLDCKIPSVTAPDDQYRFLCIVEQHKKLLSKTQPFYIIASTNMRKTALFWKRTIPPSTVPLWNWIVQITGQDLAFLPRNGRAVLITTHYGRKQYSFLKIDIIHNNGITICIAASSTKRPADLQAFYTLCGHGIALGLCFSFPLIFPL